VDDGLREAPREIPALWWVGLLLIGTVLTRVPIITSAYTYMDGDEALMGLVVQHALEGRGIPLFPYGAEFGVSFLETGSGVLFAMLFGLSETVLNLSVFAIWLAGAICLVAAVARFLGGRAALWASVLAASTPAWFHFSNVSWGYYHSAFLTCNAAVLVVAHVVDREGPHRPALALLGLFASLTYYSQPIFALALIPFMGWVVLRRRRLDDVAILAGAFGLCTLGYYLVRESNPYWAPATFANMAIVESLMQMPRRMWINATGIYFLNQDLEVGAVTRVLSLLWVALVAASGFYAIVSAVRARRVDLGVICLLSIGIVCAFSVIVDRYLWGYRYLMPTVGFEVILVASMLSRLELALGPARRWALVGGGGLMLALAVPASALDVSRVRGFSGSPVRAGGDERQAVRDLVGFLESRGVGHVYAWDGMLQWKIMFESRDRIRARWTSRSDRIPEYPAQVDRAFAAGLPVAMVGELPDRDRLRASIEATGASVEPIIVSDRFFVVLDPPKDLVEETFRLNE